MERVLCAGALLLACGCVPLDMFKTDNEATTAKVPASFFATPTPVTIPTLTAKRPQGSAAACLAVDRVGNQLIAANPQLGIKPLFSTIGSPDPEIFHQDTSGLYITEGLVRQCQSEGQLAAVLSLELGKMVSEREGLVNPALRDPPKRLPMAIPMGNAGQFSGTEQLYTAEVAKLDADKRRSVKRVVPPDPEVLARKYLEAAGFDAKELTAVAPLVQAADRNYTLEKQFKSASNPAPTWQPK
jgi:hypothetical protein